MNGAAERRNETMSKMKLKSKGSAKKRIHLTADGKLKRRKAYHGHILTKKRPNRKRRLAQTTMVGPADVKRIKPLLN